MVLGISVGSEHLKAGVVDAMGDVHHYTERPLLERQLHLTPDELLDRMRSLAHDVLALALDDEALWPSLRRSLALLGVAVAWPSPIDRQGRPRGRALRHVLWTQHPTPGSGPMALTVRTAHA